MLISGYESRDNIFLAWYIIMHEVYDFCVHIHVQPELLIIYYEYGEWRSSFISHFPHFSFVLIRDLDFCKVFLLVEGGVTHPFSSTIYKVG